tara:strand:+ start:2491 stop:3450 length:960 start_codon:yes stop_codon:yes gene_type:complete
MFEEEYIKNNFQENVKKDLAKIISGEYLGLSRNVRQINNLFSTICKENKDDKEKLIEKIKIVSEYLIKTRGKNTPGIKNALDLIFADTKLFEDCSVSEISRLIISKTSRLNKESILNAKKISTLGSKLLSKSKLILVFDYSSSVMNILREMSFNDNFVNIIVPESRILNGGAPIAKEAIEMGHNVEFIFDMAFCLKLKEVDSILIGAESFDINGDCWNTIGSYPISFVAYNLKIPVYVPTEFIKFNYKSLKNIQKEIVTENFSSVFNLPKSMQESKNISFYSQELEKIPSKYVKAYITPIGNINPENMDREIRKFFEIK